MHRHNLFQSNRYKSFIADRDLALEQIHQNTQMDCSRILFEILERISDFVAKMAIKDNLNVYNLNYLSGQLEAYTGQVLGTAFPALVERVQRMRHAVFVLTYSSEMEAIGRATSTIKDFNPHQFHHKLVLAKDKKTVPGQTLQERIWLDLMRLRSKICNQFNIALVQELEPKDILQAVQDAFPKIESFKRPPRELKPFREADTKEKKKDFYNFDLMDDGDWELALSAYQDMELPISRFDNSPMLDPEAGYYRYAWELEQDLSDDFVQQVRSGQVDAANDLGIKEFVWVAVIDNKTDECCLKRNGHTTSEIEDMLDSGKLDHEKCDASTPPAHPNCRCQLGPVASVKEVEGPDWKSFNEWLNS